VKLKAFAIVFLCGAVTCVGMAVLSGSAQGQSARVSPVSREAVPESQSTPPRPDFDLASIKLARRGALSPSNPMYLRPGNAPGSLEARNANFAFLMSNAYGVKIAQIYNDPSWVQSDGYDISAKTDLTPEEAQKIGTSLDERTADMNLRLQSLLEDRFHLKIHRETRQLPVFILTVAKAGLKLQPADCVPRGPYRRPEPGQPSPRFCGTYSLLRSGVGWKLTGLGITVKDLVSALSFQQIPNLIEQTGYTEPFNAILEWTPDSTANPPVPLPDDAAPSLITALQEQLGIKLESAKGPVQVLVIDHIERPSEN
jgi:uncharacterized protein (TIGR03435 family)